MLGANAGSLNGSLKLQGALPGIFSRGPAAEDSISKLLRWEVDGPQQPPLAD